MKKSLFTVLFACISTIYCFGQLKEGHLKYDIDVTSDNPDMAMAIQMMTGSTMEVYFKEHLSKSIMQMGTMMKVTTITDSETRKQLMLMDGMMGKKVIKTEMETTSDTEEGNPELDITLVDETKKILNYTCKKALARDQEGNEFEIWYTEEIDVKTEGHKFLNQGVPGFPMEFSVIQKGMIMKMTLSAFEEKLTEKGKTLFSMDSPEGYEEMTLDQLQMMGM